MASTKVKSRQTNMQKMAVQNLVKNGNFINNSTNGYGSTPDDWTAGVVGYEPNQVQGGRPAFTKAEFLSAVGVADGDLEGLWLLNEASGNATDLSSNGYDLTETGGTIAADSNGLLSTARDFELGDTEYFGAASLTNLNITGSQTWFFYMKPESLANFEAPIALFTGATNTGRRFYFGADGVMYFQASGLTTNTSVAADTKVEAGKWYFVCGVYDSANTSLSLWINGVKKSVTASGTTSSVTTTFTVGADFSAGGGAVNNYFDGLIQSAGVINGALTDAQVKKLWAFLGYQGMKLRDGGTDDAVLYQTLDPSDAQRLAGKTVTLRAKMYQSEASSGTLGIGEDVATDAQPLPVTESTTIATTDEWVDVALTTTLSSDFKDLTVFLNAGAGTAGTVWFKEVALYESDADLGYAHSPDDWNRFPRLLKMDIPLLHDGTSPYEYEEKRWYDFTPTTTANGGGSYTPSFSKKKYMFDGKTCHMFWNTQNQTVSGTVSSVHFTFPIVNSLPITNGAGAGLIGSDSGGNWYHAIGEDSDSIEIKKAGGNWQNAAYTGMRWFFAID